MKRLRWIPAIIGAALLAACTPAVDDTELMQPEDEQEAETTIIPNLSLSENYYKTLIPYKESAARGLVVSNLYTKYDIKEVENGLMRLSQNVFNTDKYFFQEGQYLDRDTVQNLLARPNQTQKAPADQQGLNPSSVDKDGKDLDPIVKAEQAPVYLAHLVEQNYLVKTDEDKIGIAGISVGLAMNSMYYYTKEQYGDSYERPISDAEIEKEGKRIAQELISRLRSREDIPDVPIMIGLFKQQERNSIIPGTYFTYSVVDAGKTSVDKWEKVNEEYVSLPVSSTDEMYRDLNTDFQGFKQEVDKYFSNFTSVLGTAFIKDNHVQSIEIEIPIQFYGTSELIGFTQYLTGVMLKKFSVDLPVTISITSINGPEALIKKERNEQEPFVHIYE